MSDGQTEADLGMEAQQWEGLAKELADYSEREAGEREAPEPKATEKTGGGGEGEGEADEPGERQPKPTYEELEQRYRQQGGALKEARERERSAAEQLKTFNAAIEEIRASRQAAKPAEKQPEPEKEIDPYEDPIGYVQAELAKLRGELQGASQQTREMREAEAARAEYHQFMGVVEQAENAFAATTPDYHDAAAFLEKSRRTELATLYPDSPQMDAYARQNGFPSAAHLREAIFRNDAQTVARTALQIGQNPAEAYYNLAKGRGYTTPAGKVGEMPAAKKAEAAIEAARRGQKAARTLSGGSGGPDNPLSVKDLTELYAEDPEEFDRQWEKMARAGKLG